MCNTQQHPDPSGVLPTDPIDSMDDVEALLRQSLAALPTEAADGVRRRGRPRIILEAWLWAALLVAVLRGLSHFSAVWRLLTLEGFWGLRCPPVTDEAVRKRLLEAGTAPLEALFRAVSLHLQQRLRPVADAELAPFASVVLALDESTWEAVARRLAELRALARGDPRLRLGKLSALFDLRRQQWWQVRLQADAQQNEKVGAWELLESIPARALLLMDLGYFAFPWFDALSARQVFWISRCRERTSFRVIHRFYQHPASGTRDVLIWLGVHSKGRAGHAVRLVEFVQDGRLRRYLTNVLDPQQLPLEQIARLYARRWDIERAFELLKVQLGLGLLWSARRTLVEQQIWATLIIAQLYQAARLELAQQQGLDPFAVSLPLLVRWAPRLRAYGPQPFQLLLRHGALFGLRRPARRVTILAPQPPLDEYLPCPPELVLERTPSYPLRKPGRTTGGKSGWKERDDRHRARTQAHA